MDFFRLTAVLHSARELPSSVMAKIRATYWYNTPKGAIWVEQSADSIWRAMLFGQNVRITRGDLNELVMNFLVAEGFGDAVEKFQEETGAKHMDPKILEVRMAVKNAVRFRDIGDAITKVRRFNPEILSSNFALHFNLQQQRVIERARNKKFEDALDLCLVVLAPMAGDNTTLMTDVERTLALLIFEDASCGPVGDLLDMSRLHKIASDLDELILASSGYEKDSRLSALMKLLRRLEWEQEALGVTYPYFNFRRSWIIFPPPD